jgi:predicted ester cyclase
MAQDERSREKQPTKESNTTQNMSSSETSNSGIDLLKKGDISNIMAAGGDRKQSMRGFDEDYVDIVDYIVRCTHKIWEEYGMGLIYTHYQHNAVVHGAYGTTYSREEMLTDSINLVSAFPDRRIYAEDVIWAGNDEDGFHTSHRSVAIGHNTGYGSYGPPTGRKVIRRAIANCFVRENRIIEEWVVRDSLAMVRQMGLDEYEIVDRLLAEDERKGVRLSYGHPERLIGQTEPLPIPPKTDGAFDIKEFLFRSQHEIWNWRMFNKITEYYAPNYICYTSSNRTLYGIGDFRAYVMAFIVAFPNAKLNIDQFYYLGNEREGYRTATRWTLLGTHEGPSVYGTPTGKPIQIMGITHHFVKDEKFIQEWTVFDELALLKQLRG